MLLLVKLTLVVGEVGVVRHFRRVVEPGQVLSFIPCPTRHHFCQSQQVAVVLIRLLKFELSDLPDLDGLLLGSGPLLGSHSLLRCRLF